MPLGTENRIRGVVLAGAHSWNEASAEGVFLRALVPVAQEPLIGYVVRWLRAGGIGGATICANGASRFVRSYLGDGADFGIELDYYEDPIPRGPAGCALDASLSSPAETFIVTDGTIIPQVDLVRLLGEHRKANAALTVVVTRDQAQGCGTGNFWSPVGIYVVERRALGQIQAIGYQDMKEVLIPRLYGNGERVIMYQADGYCPRVTDAPSYLSVNEWRLRQIAGEIGLSERYMRRGESWIHESASVADSVRLVGPVLVGPSTTIASSAIVVGPTSIGTDCSVGPGALVCRSVVWDGCEIGRNATVDRSILKNRARVEEGARAYDVVFGASRSDKETALQRVARRLGLRRDEGGVGALEGVQSTGWKRRRGVKGASSCVEATLPAG